MPFAQLARVSAGDTVRVEPFTPPRKQFELALLTLELEFLKARGPGAPAEEVDAPELVKQLQRRFAAQVFTEDQKLTFEFLGNNYLATVTGTLVEAADEKASAHRGLLGPKSAFVFQAKGGGGIKIINQRSSVAPNLFRSKEVSFEKLGIGGMDRQFEEIFRRAFASRVFPPHVVKRLGITHVKGMLLFGPPVRRGRLARECRSPCALTRGARRAQARR